MFRFLLSPPSSLPKQIAAQDSRLAPPLSFLTVGVFVAGMVQRLAYAVDPGESYTARAFAAEEISVMYAADSNLIANSGGKRLSGSSEQAASGRRLMYAANR